jgi:hypothetical protein
MNELIEKQDGMNVGMVRKDYYVYSVYHSN